MIKRKFFQFIQVLVLFFSVISYYKFHEAIDPKIIEAVIFFNSLISLLYFYLEKKYIALKFFFLSVFILYSNGRIFLDLFGLYPLNETKIGYIDQRILTQVMLIVLAALSSLNIGMSLKFKAIHKEILKNNRNILIKSWILMFIGIVPFFLIRLDKILVAFLYRRISYYQGVRIFPKILYKISFLDDLFLVGFFCYILFSENIKLKKKLIYFYLTLSIFTLLSGFRGQAFKDLFAIIVIYLISYRIKPNIKTLIFSGVGLAIISELIFNFRNKLSFSEIGLINLMKKFLISQGYSLEIMIYSINYQNELNNINPYTAPLKGVFRRVAYLVKDIPIPNTQSIERLKYTDTLGIHLTYLISPKKFLEQGGGFGGFAVADVYLYGGILFVVLNYFFLGYIFSKLENKAENNKYIRAFIAVFISISLTQPRSSFFISINEILLLVIGLYFIAKVKIKRNIN